MDHLVFKNKVTRYKLYEIAYDLIISGDRYPRTIQIRALNPDDAIDRWQKQCVLTNDFAECEIIGVPSFIQ